jgi:hypothetical protein
MRKPPHPARQKPHFIWQGALIVLPALLLAGACFYSLKQDRVLAEHDLAEQAQRLAKVLAQEAMPRLLQFDLPAQTNPGEPSLSPDQDAIMRILRSPVARSACLIAEDGTVVYPPPPGAIPVPSPLDLGELNPSQQDAWLSLEESLTTRKDLGVALERFIATRPPERTLAVARLRTAAALHAVGHALEAIQLVTLLRDAPLSLLGESGLPITDLAELELLQWQGAAGGREEGASRLCSRLIASPSPMAEAFWARIPRISNCLALAGSESRARTFACPIAASAPSESFVTIAANRSGGIERPVEGGKWKVGVSLEALKAGRLRVGAVAAQARASQRRRGNRFPFLIEAA